MAVLGPAMRVVRGAPSNSVRLLADASRCFRGPRADGSRSTFCTRNKPIWGPQRVELALALDRPGLDARLFLCGYELVASRGDVEIVRVLPMNSSRGIAPGRGHDNRRPRA